MSNVLIDTMPTSNVLVSKVRVRYFPVSDKPVIIGPASALRLFFQCGALILNK